MLLPYRDKNSIGLPSSPILSNRPALTEGLAKLVPAQVRRDVTYIRNEETLNLTCLWFSDFTRLGIPVIDFHSLSYQSPIYGYCNVMSELMHKSDLEQQNNMLNDILQGRFQTASGYWHLLETFRGTLSELDSARSRETDLLSVWRVKLGVDVLRMFLQGRMDDCEQLKKVAGVIHDHFYIKNKNAREGVNQDITRHTAWLRDFSLTTGMMKDELSVASVALSRAGEPQSL